MSAGVVQESNLGLLVFFIFLKHFLSYWKLETISCLRHF